ncbi:hypothetical protein GCM10027445_21830 [Amycolatopsis endophytica]|uniref:Tryptophan-rich sensory protein n=1 Tax=Amycolatopsis endophytica TaxID=860233 RepID=A0A853BFW3_9PSEU|nr:tryptophan-rich sensory protein [Amycolatopsis endophytica]NYI93447.1 hypothetical protein [Amycolatopsis endophytica]
MRTSDGPRAGAVLVTAALQFVAGTAGGAGLTGEPVGDVANSHPTLLLPAGTAFTIWSLIYAVLLVTAVWQALPAQRHRDVHRRTGWWLAVSGVLNAAWIVVFTQHWIVVSEVVIVALLACLLTAFAKLGPARGWADRLLLHIPLGLYAGWVTAATVAGAATTGAALGIRPPDTVAVVLAGAATLATAAVTVWVVSRWRAVAGYALAVAWALTWIAVATPATAVVATALTGVALVVVAAGLRLARGGRSATLG